VPEYEAFDGRWALQIENVDIDWRDEFPFDAQDGALSTAVSVVCQEIEQQAAAQVAREKRPARERTGIWLFQANPKQYDLVAALEEYEPGDEDSWTVSRYKYEMEPGDLVILWLAGKASGVYAIGELLGQPYRRYWVPEEGPQYMQADWWVEFRYTAILPQPISRDHVKADPVLGQTMVIRAPTGTNFRVTKEEWNALNHLLPSLPEIYDREEAARYEMGWTEVVVDQHTRITGEYRTIGDALDAVKPKTRILVHPGVYAESVTIDKPVEILADGVKGSVAVSTSRANCLRIRTDEARVRGFIFNSTEASAVDISRGKVVLEDCDVISQGGSGISIHGSTADPRILRCTVRGNDDDVCISATRRARGTVEGGDLSGNLVGFDIYDAANLNVLGCTIHDQSRYGIFVGANSRAHVSKCDLYANGMASIEVHESGTATVENCRMHDDEDDGVRFTQGATGVVENCAFDGQKGAGIALWGESRPTIRGCTFERGMFGLYIAGANGVIEDCEIVESEDVGVVIEQGSDPLVRQCRIHHCTSGIVVRADGRGTIQGSRVYQNSNHGITVSDGGNLSVQNCTITENGSEAIWVRKGGRATVEHSDLRGNQAGAWDVDAGAWVTRRDNKE